MASSWVFEKKKLPLKVKWSISRGSLSEKVNGFVSFKDDGLKGIGEVAFLTHGETSIDDIEDAFSRFKNEAPSYINGLDDLTAVLSSMELPSALRFAIESSYVHYLSQVMDSTQQRVLGVREVSNIQTSYSIPLMPIEELASYIGDNDLNRFHCLKIKVASFEDYKFVLKVGEIFSGKLRIDGNECFSDAKEVLGFLEPLSDLPLEFLEQPLPSGRFEEAISLREKCKVLLMADESVQDGPIVDEFQKMFHGINIKLMKAGGYIKAMNQLREARSLGLKTMIGCMVETSVGISSAMNIAHGVDFFDLDGFLLLKDDPFKLVYEDKGSLYYSHNH